MTQHEGAPVTRRALRAAQAQALVQADEAAGTAPAPTEPSDVTPAPVAPTRRALREAARRAEAELQVARPEAQPPVARPEAAPRDLAAQQQLTAGPVQDRQRDVPAQPRVTAQSGVPAVPVQRATTARPTEPTGPSPADVPTPALPVQQGPGPVAEGAPSPRLTRRELRSSSAAEPARAPEPQVCRPPFAASLVLPTPPRVPQARAALSRIGARPLTVVALAAGLLVGGVTQVQAEQGIVAQVTAQAQAEADAHAAAVAEEERRGRVANATSARLAAQAASIASDRRTEALAAAQVAVATAEGARTTAESVVDPVVLASLDEAAAELAALLETAPAVEELTAVSLPDADDAVDGVGGVDGEPAETPDSATEAPPMTEDDAAVLAAGAAAAPAQESPAPSSAPVPEALDPAEAVAQLPVDRTARASRVGPGLDQAPATGRAAPDQRVAQALQERLEELDLDVSERIIEAAGQVTELSEQVQATAEALIAEEEARLAAEEAARVAAEEAARAAAAELARKVAVAESATNGRIPAEALCGVSFDARAQLRCDAAAALEQLNAAYRADFGRDLKVVSSYRSYDAQVSTRRTRGSLAATPGTSNHGRGLAVDFADFGGLGNFRTANYRWMRANSERFGWHHPAIMRPGGGGPQEPWHWEFGTR